MRQLFKHRIVGALPAAVTIGYIVHFKKQTWTVFARSKTEAAELAARHFKARRPQYPQILVALADANWSPLSSPAPVLEYVRPGSPTINKETERD